MTYLNSDLLNNIFNFFWYKDIIKCELVSKLWFNTINKMFQYKRILCSQLSLHLNNYSIDLDSNISYKNSLFYIYPLPTSINISQLPTDVNNKIIFKNDSLYFIGQELGGNRIIYMNNYLPYTEPVPFIFPILRNNKYYLQLSNIYYFEISIEKTPFRQSWNDECIGIGFTEKHNQKIEGYQVGWFKGSYGFHSDDGNIYKGNGHGYSFSDSWTKGDVIGCGIIFSKRRRADIFYTKNGIFLGKAFENIKISNHLIPSISLDSSSEVNINFGQDEYKFPIENIIKDHVQISNKIPINPFIDLNNKVNISDFYTKEIPEDIPNIVNQFMMSIYQSYLL